jgi:hypothetical protein
MGLQNSSAEDLAMKVPRDAFKILGTLEIRESVRLHYLGASLDARVVKAPFVDPAGTRVNG